MKLSDWTPPNCPQCKADSMRHICFSHVTSGAAFKKNGWYCDRCKSGPFQLGNVTEADAAIFAKQLNAPRKRHEAIKSNP